MAYADGHLYDERGTNFARVKDGHVWIDGKIVADELDGVIYKNGRPIGTLFDADRSREASNLALVQQLRSDS